MKKQIIVIASVALAAVLLFTSYVIFFKDDGIEEVGDPFYTLSDEIKETLSEIDGDIEILLVGYDGDDTNWETIYRFSEAIIAENKDFSLETAEKTGDFCGVTVKSESGSEDIALDSFFKKLYDGTAYAFDGESLIVNSILSQSGKEKKEIALRALAGYDTDGDTVTANNLPFMFPSIERSKIAFLTINNEHGKYSIYKDGNDFYFGASRAIGYDDEMFSLLTTNCRYPVAAYGKMKLPEGKTFASYGLDSEENATVTYSLMTEADKDGNYFLHTVYIGDRASSGAYYYARYIGGKFGKETGDGSNMTHNLSKDLIYFISADTVEGSLSLPQTDIMQPTIVNAITGNEQLFSIDDIRIDLYGDGVSAIAKNLGDFNAAPNLSAVDASALTTVISDKTSAKSYSEYPDGWIKHIDVFAAFTSSDGKSTYIDAALARKGGNSEYKISFGLLRDESKGAYLPSKVTLTKSYDGVNFVPIENGEIMINHSDREIKKYEFSFTDPENVKYIRIGFDVPQKAMSYVVFDEIRIYVGDDDAQPSSAIGGQWKLTAPYEYIAEGMNYSFLDMSNFNNFVQIIASLEGERVVACGFADNGDATSLDTALLAEYGLAEPDKHFSFEYEGIVTDIYVSKPNEAGKYYLYSVFTGELNGETVNATTDVIVEVSTETASWLAWDIVEYLDHSLFSIYIVDITDMEITVDGVTHEFDLILDSEGKLGDVKYKGESYDVKSFKYLYQSIIGIYMQDAYTPSETDEPVEFFRVKIHTETNSPEVVFYRVSSSRCYFTIDGQGSYYALVEDVIEAREKLAAYVRGEIVGK